MSAVVPSIKTYPKATVGGYIFAKDNTVLFFYSHKWPGVLSTPGGKVQQGERMVEAFIREIREEASLEIENISFLSCRDVVYSKEYYKPSHMIFHNFAASLSSWQSKEDVVLNEEAQRYCWLTIEEALKQNVQSAVREDLLMLQKRASITLKNIAVPVYLGVYSGEQKNKQTVHFTISYTSTIPQRDDLHEVVNYENIVHILKQVCESKRFQLIETLAAVAQDTLAKRFSCCTFKLSVRKHYPLKELECAEVTVGE